MHLGFSWGFQLVELELYNMATAPLTHNVPANYCTYLYYSFLPLFIHTLRYHVNFKYLSRWFLNAVRVPAFRQRIPDSIHAIVENNSPQIPSQPSIAYLVSQVTEPQGTEPQEMKIPTIHYLSILILCSSTKLSLSLLCLRENKQSLSNLSLYLKWSNQSNILVNLLCTSFLQCWDQNCTQWHPVCKITPEYSGSLRALSREESGQ